MTSRSRFMKKSHNQKTRRKGGKKSTNEARRIEKEINGGQN